MGVATAPIGDEEDSNITCGKFGAEFQKYLHFPRLDPDPANTLGQEVAVLCKGRQGGRPVVRTKRDLHLVLRAVNVKEPP